MKYNPQIHHRKSIRLKGYDYSQAGLYFITICCQDRAHLFGYIENREMILNKYGEIAFSEWQATDKIRDNCQIHEYIIMPNHIHGIIEIRFKKENPKKTENQEDKKDKEEKEDSTGELQFAPTPTKFKSPSQTIGSIIRGFKIATIKKIKEEILSSEGNKEKKDHKNNHRAGELPFAATAASTKKIKSLDFKIWQRNYWEHIIRNENEYQRIAQYIMNNPQKWDNDTLKN